MWLPKPNHTLFFITEDIAEILPVPTENSILPQTPNPKVAMRPTEGVARQLGSVGDALFKDAWILVQRDSVPPKDLEHPGSQ